MSVFTCPNCGESVDVDIRDHHCVCPRCGKGLVFTDDDRYCISELLYQAGRRDLIASKEKKDRWIGFRNAFRRAFNWFAGIPKGIRYAVIGGICVLVVGGIAFRILTAPVPIGKSMAYADRDSLWNSFRSVNPYNTQIVGLKEYPDGSCNLLISEPDEHVTLRSLTSLVSKFNADLNTYQIPLGYDGWLKDVVISMNDLKPSAVDRFRSVLFNHLYGTDYKAFFYDLDNPPRHVGYAFESLNYQVSSEELKNWLIDSGELFEDQDGAGFTMENLVSRFHPGVYYSDNPGFVVWMLDPEHLQEKVFRKDARIFSLDADLILGAFRKDGKVAIVGRERSAPLDELPPMRLSTIMMLASTTEKELSQSYERNNFFAGKLPGGKDYAPILLSNELWHTEYGSILNITDQMLKSWSENGSIHYELFGYPSPVEWAFEIGALKDLKVNELTYNWNTDGAGYIIEASEDCPYDIFAVNRTGSLPVSYIPGDTEEIDANDKVYLAEETAYDFFSNLSAPELVKVNQYAILYQIFTNFGISIPAQEESAPVTTRQLDVKMADILQGICEFQADSTDMDKLRAYQQKEIDNMHSLLESPDVDDEMKTLIVWGILFSDAEEDAAALRDSVFALNRTIHRFNEKGLGRREFLEKVGHYYVNPRDIDYSRIGWLVYYWNDLDQLRIDNDLPTSRNQGFGQFSIPNSRYVSDAALRSEMIEKSDAEELVMFYAHQLQDRNSIIRQFNEAMGICPLPDAKEIYLAENREVSKQWIKCPTIVQSWSERDSVISTGGHNLNPKVTPIKVDPKLKKGMGRVEMVDGKKTIVVSAADRGSISPSFLRQVERTGMSGEVKFAKARSLRPRETVFPKAGERSSRGFNKTDHIRIRSEEVGFKIGEKRVATMDELFDELHSQLMSEGGGERTLVFENVNERTVRVISDGVGQSSLLDKGSVAGVKRGSFQMGKVQYDYSREAEGIVTVRVPIKPEGSRIKARTHLFDVPKQYLNEFMTRLRNFLKDINKDWSFRKFKQSFEGSGLDPELIHEIEEYKVAHLILHPLKQDHHVLVVFEETA